MSGLQHPRKDVLVADGIGFYRRMLVELLRGQGYRVFEAENADQALARLAENRPDLVLLDVQLPPGGGAAFLVEAEKRGHHGMKTVALAPPGVDESDWRHFARHNCSTCVLRSAPIDDILVAARSVLFPEEKNLRRSPRAQAHIPVTYQVESEAGELGPELVSHSFNLSADGMFVVNSADAPCPPGTKVVLCFWVPGAREVIRAEGVTIWSNQAGGRMNELYPPGMGIMFLALASEASAAVDEYVRRRSAGPLH